MDKIICINKFISKDEEKRSKNFNEIWQRIVNISLKK